MEEQQAAHRLRQHEAAVRELRELGLETADASAPLPHKAFPRMSTVQCVVQADIATVHVPLDYGRPIAVPDADAPQIFNFFLHTDRSVPMPPMCIRARWTPNVRPNEHHELHGVDGQTCIQLRPVSSLTVARGSSCWMVALQLPAAFAAPELLATEAPAAPQEARAGEATQAQEVTTKEKPAGPTSSGEQHPAAAQEAAREAGCLLSRGIVLRSTTFFYPAKGMVAIRVGDRSIEVPAADPEYARRTVHVQGFIGGALPPYDAVRLVSNNGVATVQNLPLPLLMTRGTLQIDLQLTSETIALEPEVCTAEIADLTPAQMLEGTLFMAWPRVPPGPDFPRIAAHWRAVYLDLLGSISAMTLAVPPAERLRLHAHLLTFVAHQASRACASQRNARELMTLHLRALLLGAAVNSSSATGSSTRVPGPTVTAEDVHQFVSDALAVAAAASTAGASPTEKSSSVGGSSSSIGSAGSRIDSAGRSSQVYEAAGLGAPWAPREMGDAQGDAQSESVLWLLGLAGQLAHAMHEPVHANGEPAPVTALVSHDSSQSSPNLMAEIRPPDSVWAALTPRLWSGEGLAALTGAVEQMRPRYGWCAVRKGLSALLGLDAKMLLAHQHADGHARGVSSYRFCRLLPLRAALLGESSARQYTVQLAVDAAPRWRTKARHLRSKNASASLLEMTVLREWEAVRAAAAARGPAHAARQRFEQVQGLLALAQEASGLVCPSHTARERSPMAKGEWQLHMVSTATLLCQVSREVLDSARTVPALWQKVLDSALTHADDTLTTALGTLFAPTWAERLEAHEVRPDQISDGLPHEAALAALISDESRPWGALRSAHVQLQRVLELLDKERVRTKQLASWRSELPLTRLQEKLAGLSGGSFEDLLEQSGLALMAAKKEAVQPLRTLHTELKALECEYGPLNTSSVNTVRDGTANAPYGASSAYACYPMQLAGGDAPLGQPVCVVPWDERRFVVIDRAGSAVRVLDAGKGEVSNVMSTAKKPGGACMYAEGVLVVADTGNAVLRFVDVGRGDNQPIHFAGTVGKPGARDGWDGSLHSPTSVVRLPGGELLVADTGNHTLRLVELGANPKNKLVASIPELSGANAHAKMHWDTDMTLRHVGEQRKQAILGKLTTVAGKAGVAGSMDGKTGESLLARPTSLAMLSKSDRLSSVVLFLQPGDVQMADGGNTGAPLLRQLVLSRVSSSSKTNELPRFACAVSTLFRFGEAPRRGPTSVIELTSGGKQLLVADQGRLLELTKCSATMDSTDEAASREIFVATPLCDATGQVISMLGGDELYLGNTPGGVVTVADASMGGKLYRLLTPALWKKASRKFERLLEQIDEVVEPLRVACAKTIDQIHESEMALVEAEATLRAATLAAQRTAYAAECHFLIGVQGRDEPSLPKVPAGGSLALSALLINAPMFQDLLALLGTARLPAEQLDETRRALSTYIRGIKWPAAVVAAQADVAVLQRLALAQPGLVDEDVVAAVLHNASFAAPLDKHTLQLLEHCRKHEQACEEGRPFSVNGPAASGIVAWLCRLAPSGWHKLPACVEDGRKPLEAVSALTLLTWAAGLVPLDAQRSADEQSAVAWVLDLLCRSLEDAQRGAEMLVAISELLRQAPNMAPIETGALGAGEKGEGVEGGGGEGGGVEGGGGEGGQDSTLARTRLMPTFHHAGCVHSLRSAHEASGGRDSH